MDRLEEDVSSQADRATLERAADACERELSTLFRKWPELSAQEKSRLRKLYDERVRIARSLGRIRAPER